MATRYFSVFMVPQVAPSELSPMVRTDHKLVRRAKRRAHSDSNTVYSGMDTIAESTTTSDEPSDEDHAAESAMPTWYAKDVDVATAQDKNPDISLVMSWILDDVPCLATRYKHMIPTYAA